MIDPSELSIKDTIATVPVPAQAEECSDNGNDVPNYYDIEVLVLGSNTKMMEKENNTLGPSTRLCFSEMRMMCGCGAEEAHAKRDDLFSVWWNLCAVEAQIL